MVILMVLVKMNMWAERQNQKLWRRKRVEAVARKGTEIFKNYVLWEGLVTNIHHTYVWNYQTIRLINKIENYCDNFTINEYMYTFPACL